MPVQETIPGRDVRFWSFDTNEDGSVKGFVKKTSEVTVAVPDPTLEGPAILDDQLSLADQDLAKIREYVAAGIRAEAEEKAGSTPAGTFSTAMVAALDKSMKLNPLFSTIKSSKERRESIMRWIGSQPGMKEVMLTAYEGVRNAKATEDEE